MPLARSVLKNLKGSPIPAKASTRLPRSDATDTSSALRWADSTGLPCDAIARDGHRDRARHHQRLVTDIRGRVSVGIDPDRPVQPSTIATTEHDRRLAEVAQHPGESQHHRRLAGAADMIVADAKHGDAGIETLALQSPRRHRAIERAERQ